MAQPERKSTRLNASVRNACWIRANGTDGIAPCYCCHLEQVTRSNFDAGHVISRANGGSDELPNLRPICGCCNSSSGVEHMRDFAIRNGLAGRITTEKAPEPPSSTSTVSVLPLPTESSESKSSKTACQTCQKLFALSTLIKYDGKNCYKCFQLNLIPQKLKLVKANAADTEGVVRCAHCNERNIVTEE